MYKRALHDSFNLRNAIGLLRYKVEFRREHPYWFDPIGTAIFCGAQGSGKTLSGVNYVYNVLKDYPYCVLVTNVAMRDYPFNAGYKVGKDGMPYLYDLETGETITSEHILTGVYKRVCVEYDGLDTLKYVENGEYGVLYFIDELHLELNSLESKNIDIDVMVEISQQRKQRKHIVGTSQVYMRLAKPLREQIFNIVICRNFLRAIQWNTLIDGERSTEKDGKLNAKVIGHYGWLHAPAMYERYDTYAKMKRYRNEWQGHKRDTPQYQQNLVLKEMKKK